jgi:hypothetical protein
MIHEKMAPVDEPIQKKEREMDGAKFWKSIEEQVKNGRCLRELRTELSRPAIIGSFLHHYPPLAFSASNITPITTTTTTKEDTRKQRLDKIKVHVKLCVMIWAATGSSHQKQWDGSHHSAFVKSYAKCLRKKIKTLKKREQKQYRLKDKTEEQIVLEDLARILQTAAFCHEPQASMSQFLQDCIPKDCYWPRMGYLWNYFELQNPFETPPKPAELPPLIANRKKRKQVKPTATSDTTPKKFKENQLFPDQVALTAPFRKHNSLTQRNRFVGSHFNSGLSNMDVLFRQVTVIKKKSLKQLFQQPTPRHNIPVQMVVPPTPCVIRRKPVLNHEAAAIVAGAFRSIKRQRTN